MLKKPTNLEKSLTANFADGILVMHHGKVVYETYAGCLDPTKRHGAMSMTKSFVGLLGEMLIAEGQLDESKFVRDYIPELTESAFGDATVRQVLDMTTSLDYSEDYSDPNAGVWQHAAAGNPLPKPADYTGCLEPILNFYKRFRNKENMETALLIKPLTLMFWVG